MPLIRHWLLNLWPLLDPQTSGLGCGLKARNAGADLLGAASIRQVFQQALIRLDRCRALAAQLLGAGDADEAFLIEEVLRLCSVDDGLKGGLGCSVILLRLPAVRDVETRQSGQAFRARLRPGGLVARAGLGVLAGAELDAAEDVGGLGDRG